MLCNVNHLRSQDTSCTVEGGERFVELSHLTADRRILFYDINGEACVGNVKRGLNAGDTAADNQCAFCYRGFTGGEGCVEVNLCNGCLTEDDCFFGTGQDVLMYPRALFADVCDFNHVGVETCSCRGLTECCFMHSGGAGANNDTSQFIIGNGLLDNILSCLRTHILIIGGKNDTGFVFQGIGYRLYIDCTRDITTTPTDKNTNSLHFVFSSLFIYCIF